MINQIFKEETLKQLFEKYGKVYNAKETIFEEGSLPSKFYIIYSGKVKIVVDGTVLNTLSDGEIFGEISLLDKKPRSASAITVTECKLLVLEDDMFDELIDDSQISFNLLKIMIHRISRLSDISIKLLRRKERTRILVSLSNLIQLKIKIVILNLNKNKSDIIILNLDKVVSAISSDTKIEKEIIEKHFKDMELNNKLKIKDNNIIIKNVMFVKEFRNGAILIDWLL